MSVTEKLIHYFFCYVLQNIFICVLKMNEGLTGLERHAVNARNGTMSESQLTIWIWKRFGNMRASN